MRGLMQTGIVSRAGILMMLSCHIQRLVVEGSRDMVLNVGFKRAESMEPPFMGLQIKCT